MNDKLNPKEMVIAGRVRLLFGSVFFGTLATHMRLVETDNVPTMGVDGVSLFFNPAFVKSLSKSEIEGVLCHEILHIVNLTHLRRGSRNPKVWNQATDYAINLLLKDEGFTLPDGGLYNEKFRDWSSEKIYDYLMDHPEEQMADGNDGWNVGAVMDGGSGSDDGQQGPPMSAAEIEAAVCDIKAKIQAAAMAAKKAGQLSGNMERLISKVCAPKANWRVILQRFIAERAFCDWQYNRCHMRQLHQYGVFNPVLGGEQLGELALIIDVSGSIDDGLLQQFAGEISDILDNYPCKVTVVYCDTAITNIEEFTQDDLPLRLHCGRSGGGTTMKPSFDWVAENVPEAVAVILYSDSQLADWKQIEQPCCPAIMACTESRVDPGVPDWLEVVDLSE